MTTAQLSSSVLHSETALYKYDIIIIIIIIIIINVWSCKMIGWCVNNDATQI